ncbi:hypothetical protein GGS20DRAFT_587454 [Poronia punctata]|nr:hypothetical protein GGS20DRAFT_587454 [Poronia punctata]
MEKSQRYGNADDLSMPHAIAATKRLLTAYFKQDKQKRFVLECQLTADDNAVLWKVRYQEPVQAAFNPRIFPGPSISFSPVRYLILKTGTYYMARIRDEEKAERNAAGDAKLETDFDPKWEITRYLIDSESLTLHILQRAKHVIKEVKVQDDPLSRQFPGIRPHHMEHHDWMYLEYLEKYAPCLGRLKSETNKQTCQWDAPKLHIPSSGPWISKSTQQDVMEYFSLPLCFEYVPLWLGPRECLLRLRHLVLSQLQNVTQRYLVFGNPPAFGDAHEEEHKLIPILKVMNFTCAEFLSAAEGPHSQEWAKMENIRAVGEIIAELILLEPEKLGQVWGKTDKLVYVQRGAPRIITQAGFLFTEGDGMGPFTWLDRDLRDLVGACCAKDENDRPALGDLLDTVAKAVRERDEHYYKFFFFMTYERDEMIKNIVEGLITQPDRLPPYRFMFTGLD